MAKLKIRKIIVLSHYFCCSERFLKAFETYFIVSKGKLSYLCTTIE